MEPVYQPLWKGINGSPGPRAQSPEPRAVIMELRVLWVLAVVLTLLVSTSEARRYSKGEYLLAFLLQPGNECEWGAWGSRLRAHGVLEKGTDMSTTLCPLAQSVSRAQVTLLFSGQGN